MIDHEINDVKVSNLDYLHTKCKNTSDLFGVTYQREWDTEENERNKEVSKVVSTHKFIG